jgi:hypothetical protein
MRRILSAAAMGLVLTGAARAQPYGYYPGPGAEYAYQYAPPRAYGYDGGYTPYSYYNGYDWYYPSGYASAGPLPGPTLGPDVLIRAPRDRWGPDPNGVRAPDGHRIKCKLVESWTGYGYTTRRECW